MTSGQLFRWSRFGDSGWLGIDGPFWYRVSPGSVEGSLFVETNGSEATFEALFRLGSETDGYLDELRRRGPELIPLIDANRGLRLTAPGDPVETMFSFLCSSNNHVARITKMVGELAKRGEPFAGDFSEPAHRFPDLGKLALFTESELRAKGFGYRGATIPRVAQMLLGRGGEAYLASLATEPSDSAREALLSLPGVGPKLADCILLFALGRTEVVPIDTHMWQAITRHYLPEWKGEALTERRYRQAANVLADRFGPLAGWAQQYLFFDNMLNWRARSSQTA